MIAVAYAAIQQFGFQVIERRGHILEALPVFNQGQIRSDALQFLAQ